MDDFQKDLAKLRGTSLTGQPRLRVVAGWDERDFRGQHKYIDPTTNKPFESWILEKWVETHSGFFGTPEEWEANRYFYDNINAVWADGKGPYPTPGMYVMVCPLIHEGKRLPLNDKTLIAVKQKLTINEDFASLNQEERDQLLRDHRTQIAQQSDYVAEKKQEYIDEYFFSNAEKINRGVTRSYSTNPR